MSWKFRVIFTRFLVKGCPLLSVQSIVFNKQFLLSVMESWKSSVWVLLLWFFCLIRPHILPFASFPLIFQSTKESSIRNYLKVSIFEINKVGFFFLILGLQKNRAENTESSHKLFLPQQQFPQLSKHCVSVAYFL